MIEFAPDDFAPLDDFPLLWRWARPSHDPLPSEVLATLRPLTPARAAALVSDGVWGCADGEAEPELVVRAATDQAAVVRARLAGLGIAPAQRVVVSWSAQAALVTRWSTFADYWEAFCYPSSDDVSVWEPGGSWALCYHHSDVIEFRRR